MPMDRRRYPAQWPLISFYIRFVLTRGRCEWCGARHGEAHPETGSVVTLTVHHRGVCKPDGGPGSPHDKMDCRRENLVALCNRCHWAEDLPIHIARAADARRQEQIAHGQGVLFDVPAVTLPVAETPVQVWEETVCIKCGQEAGPNQWLHSDCAWRIDQVRQRTITLEDVEDFHGERREAAA